MINLSNQIMLITGASRGIGRATALMAAKAGAAVAVNYRQAQAESLVAEIVKNGGKAAAFHADVSIYAEVENMVAQVLQRFRQIDILVNNAGIWTYGEIDTMPEAIWDETIAANLKSIYNCCRLVTPHMKARRSGKIINISSTAGQRGGLFTRIMPPPKAPSSTSPNPSRRSWRRTTSGEFRRAGLGGH
jgi:3-oxoacyl-[acyl-carrier protein] reductase